MSENGSRPYRTIRDWAGDERPRERLLEHGPETLSDAELLAIILRSGMAGENVVDMARNLIDSFGGIDGLLRAGPAALQRAKGLGPAKAAQIAASIELGRRAQAIAPGERPASAHCFRYESISCNEVRSRTRNAAMTLNGNASVISRG